MSEVALVCKKKNSNQINYVDFGMCHRRFYFFGAWKPDFECGNKNNEHECVELNKVSKEYIEILKSQGHLMDHIH